MSAFQSRSLRLRTLAAMAAGALAFGTQSIILGAEVKAEPVCRQCQPTTAYAPATAYRPVTVYQPVTVYSPDPCCERVGPVRRFLRRVFRPCCPPPVVAARAVVYPVAPSYPPVVVPAPAFPSSPPVMLERPVPPAARISPIPPSPPPPIESPAAGSSLRRNWTPPSPQPAAPPPAATPPIRFERIASRTGETTARAKVDPAKSVTLIQVGEPANRKPVMADDNGRIRVELTPGTWAVLVLESGKQVETGRLVIRERAVVQVRVLGS